MKHKHAELIKAWADGAKIEVFSSEWLECPNPSWFDCCEYRIKPEPKPDIVVSRRVVFENSAFCTWHSDNANLKLTFDGETGKLKTAEVL